MSIRVAPALTSYFRRVYFSTVLYEKGIAVLTPLKKPEAESGTAVDIAPFLLPPPALQDVLDLAAQSDILLLGEFHGTQEVPRLMLGLLNALRPLGYGVLAFEISHDERDTLVKWAKEELSEPPRFFTHPDADGRGNEQTLALIYAAVRQGWQILCFDVGREEPFADWRERDALMAQHFAAQWNVWEPQATTGRKVLGVCGNLHSRLAQMSGDMAAFWPSLAANLQIRCPYLSVGTIVLWFHRGTYFNGGKVNELMDRGKLLEAEVRDGNHSQHSLALHLPEAQSATFLPVASSVSVTAAS